MSTILRTLRYIRRIGLKEYVYQMNVRCVLVTDLWLFTDGLVGGSTAHGLEPPHDPPAHVRRPIDGATGDTKAGTLVGTDRYGNRYYENSSEELPCRLLGRIVGKSYRVW